MNILLILLLSTGAGRQFYVAPGGSNSADGSALHPWATNQKAANTVAAGDTVHVAPGTYNETVSIQASGTSSAPITFISDVKWGAKIRSGNSIYAVQIGLNTNPPTAGNYVRFQGFDVSGDPRYVWTGILCWASHCQITGNYVHDIPTTTSGSNGGSGIVSANYSPSASNNSIIGNVVSNIGMGWAGNCVHGIYISNNQTVVANNIIYNIQAFGIHLYHYANRATIANNLVWGCGKSGEGGQAGIIMGTSNTVLDYCVITNNIVINNSGYAIKEYVDGSGQIGTHNTYSNNITYGNTAGNYNLLVSVPQNVMTANAQFVNYQANGTGNYHLAAGSPCIDSGRSQGAPTTDYDGVSRPQGAGYDIGPYEWAPLGSRGTPSPGRSAAASQVDRSQHASMLYTLLGVSGVAMVLLVALVFVLSSARPRRHPRPTSNFLVISVTGILQVIVP